MEHQQGNPLLGIMIKTLTLIFIGGGVGSILRYLVNIWCADINARMHYPVGTFIANIAGCFIIGFLTALFAKYATASNDVKTMLTVGLCGGFTTFSTFSNESLGMLRSGNITMFALYIGLSITLGILAALAGNQIVK